MDSSASDLAAEAGKAIVQAMASDGWDAIQSQILHRLGLDSSYQLLSSLSADRAAIRTGRLSVETVAGRWQVRLEFLLESSPERSPEVAALVEELRNSAAPRPAMVHQTMTGTRGRALQAGGSIVGSGNTTTNRKHYGGILVVVAVAVVLLIVGAGVVNNVILPAVDSVADSSSITADTTCGDYLQHPQGEREQAVQQIAVEKQVSGAGHPFLVLNVDDQCGNELDSPVGDVVARQQY